MAIRSVDTSNLTENNLQAILSILDKSMVDFYPTGSRYFGTATQYSDWDYFTVESRATEGWLVGYGFREIINRDNSYYLDDACVKVYRWESGDPGRHVDVQFIYAHMMEVKKKAQVALRNCPFNWQFQVGGSFSKRASFWNWMYSLCKEK